MSKANIQQSLINSLRACAFFLALVLVSAKTFSQPICIATFQHYPNTHNPDSIHFYPATTTNIGTYSWSFGDGTNSTGIDPWHLYQQPGAYYVCLTVSLTNGGSCTWCDSVHVINVPPPTCNAQFQFYTNPHNSDSLHFYASAPSSAVTNYAWNFGDGSTGSGQYPWHEYTNPGSYWVCLTVTIANGPACTWCDSIHVTNPPPPTCNARFQSQPNTHNPDSIHFIPISPSSTATYSWSFGDGSSSTNIDPWHFYPNAGAYWVCLTITLSNGATCNWCDSVHVISPPPPICNAHFQFYSNPHNPDSIHFYGSTLSSIGATYAWTFGDGTTGSGLDPWHLYANAGAYYVCLTVTLSNNTTCTWCDSIHVINPPPPTCNAHFQHYPNTHNPDSIHFYAANASTTGAIYAWTFGDGTTGSGADPWHLYANPGAYYVCLTVTLSNNTTCSWCDSIHIMNPPPPVCNAHFIHYNSPHNPDSVHFYPATPTSTIATYSWSFGDGSTSTNIDPWHLYANAGTYYACLTVTLGNGTSCTWCDSIHVTNPPPPVCNAQFQFYANSHNPDSIHFYPYQPTNTLATYSWSFGDGSASTNHDPWHMYANSGTYYVCLTVTLTNGSSCTWCDSVHVIHHPPVCNAHYQFYPNPLNLSNIHFYPATIATNMVTYSWSFGDGTNSTAYDPWHQYQHGGAYYVCLTVTISGGTTCTWCDSIHVMNPPPPVCNAQFMFYTNPHNTDSVHYYPVNPTNSTASYQWSFGDGTTSTAHDPWHLYSTHGMYFTCLTVTLPNGTTCLYCDSVLGAPIQPPNPIDQYSATVKLTPNPVNTSFMISIENVSDRVDFEIRDFTGHSVHNSTFIGDVPSEINTSMLNPGYYYYTVRKGGQIISQGKLIVMH